MKNAYPFDPSIKHHLIIAFGLAIWIFIFLFFTEPLDVGQLDDIDKLKFPPIYGLFGATCYLLCLPLQVWLAEKEGKWLLGSELIFMSTLILIGFVTTWLVYFYIVMDANPYAYTIDYFAKAIYLPAALTVFPILGISRWSFGKYKEKQLEKDKIEIRGVGNFEGLRLHWRDLIYIQSSDNYVEVFFKDGEKLKTQLIRNKLSTVEEQVPELIRTHRSFLINPAHFNQWKTGNRKLHICLSEGIEVPVSKTYQEGLIAAVNFTTD
ncbi:LytTR family DNA-binding domain-containing protein [Algoriphagus machipongonensis]|uniref:LytTr DNA-binding domain protein n=1 Tax=Algoriphagus machipongonensis TaxID=388413 RepID=A3HYR4_9BACT|nr:LytTR family DNA-binding domain-containing protein [Algoriphagus machipongonensis]EAZ80400.1 LytTr DNA-binding domain protein [Algoriphagus machipongonensis]